MAALQKNDAVYIIGSKKAKYSKYSRFEKRDFAFVYALIAFPVIQFAIFWLYVNSSSIALAFQNTAGKFTWNNFKSVFDAFVTTDIYGFNLRASLLRSMSLWAIQYCVCFPIAIITTYVLFRRIFGHFAWRVCFIIPGLMGAVIWTTLIRYMVAYDGVIVKVWTAIGAKLPEEALRNGLFGSGLTSFPTLIVTSFIMGIVGNNVVLTGAFSRMPNEIYESAKLDGAGFWTQCFRLAIPCIWPTIATLLTFGLCSIFVADYNVFLYSQGTGQPNMSTIGFQIYYLTYRISLAGDGATSYGYPAALGLCITLITLPVVLIGRFILERFNEPVEY